MRSSVTTGSWLSGEIVSYPPGLLAGALSGAAAEEQLQVPQRVAAATPSL
jgi:hypothetical protein